MKISYTTLFVKGEVEPALRVEVGKLKDLNTFRNMSSPGFEGLLYTKGRISGEALEEVNKNPGILNDYISTYNHYVLHLIGMTHEDPLIHPQICSLQNPSITRFTNVFLHLDTNDHPSYEYRDMLKRLVKDCSSRMPYEFDKTGRDPGWFFLGERVLLLKNTELKGGIGKKNNYIGFVSYTLVDHKTVKVWLAYTREDYRGEKVFSTLISHLQRLCSSMGIEEIQIATDTTEQNTMNEILLHKGFKLKSRTYRSVTSLQR